MSAKSFTASKTTPENRSAFMYPERMRRRRIGPDMALLLWRILQVQPEVRDGRVHVMRNAFLKSFRDSDADLSEYGDALTRNIAGLIRSHGRERLGRDFSRFVMRVTSHYRREQLMLTDPARLMSLDILFQTIQLLTLNATMAEAENVIQHIGTHYPASSISALDREVLVRNFRAYLFLARKIISSKSLRQALEQRDALIAATAERHPHVMVYILDCMLRYIVAQILLARKYRCDTLIVEWMKEYGFGPEEMVRIARYIPYDTGFLRFRANYRTAIRELKNYRPPTANALDSDVFLLRSLSIFYTSWIMKMSEQLPAN